MTPPRSNAKSQQSKSSGSEHEPYIVQVVDKAFEILDLVQRAPDPLSLAEITRAVHYSKSSIFRVLNTLERRRLVTRTHGDRYIAAGIGTAGAGSSVVADLVGQAEPVMRDLGRQCRETVSLAVLFEDHIGVVAVVNSPQKIHMGNTVRGIIPPHASSLGKCILAHQPERRRDHLLRAYGLYALTPHTITDEVALGEELERVRERGYSIEREESEIGGCCFGAAIHSPNDEVISALSISAPVARMTDEDKLIRGVVDAAAALSAQLSNR